MPKSGLSAPRNAGNGSLIRALGQAGTVKMGAVSVKPQKTSGDAPVSQKGVRISAALGEVRLNFQKVTHGLAHGALAPGSAKNASGRDTIWSDAKASAGGANGLSQGNSNAGDDGNTAGSNGATTSSTIAAIGPANQSGNGNGNGANGNGNNGNGNGGAGNGKGRGNAKH